ncbi:hypothetical protein HAX54_047251 [Datura stramonium]|uniref:Uncharacterized protein n=1 Tax=Datura stramonium TaxID=4076 RepID=A0ABS8RQL5_DATST|nr:hypothetical protein [Datura stramonium]
MGSRAVLLDRGDYEKLVTDRRLAASPLGNPIPPKFQPGWCRRRVERDDTTHYLRDENTDSEDEGSGNETTNGQREDTEPIRRDIIKGKTPRFRDNLRWQVKTDEKYFRGLTTTTRGHLKPWPLRRNVRVPIEHGSDYHQGDDVESGEGGRGCEPGGWWASSNSAPQVEGHVIGSKIHLDSTTLVTPPSAMEASMLILFKVWQRPKATIDGSRVTPPQTVVPNSKV